MVPMPRESVNADTGNERQAQQDVDGRAVRDAGFGQMDRHEDECDRDDEKKRAQPPDVIEVLSQGCFSRGWLRDGA